MPEWCNSISSKNEVWSQSESNLQTNQWCWLLWNPYNGSCNDVDCILKPSNLGALQNLFSSYLQKRLYDGICIFLLNSIFWNSDQFYFNRGWSRYDIDEIYFPTSNCKCSLVLSGPPELNFHQCRRFDTNSSHDLDLCPNLQSIEHSLTVGLNRKKIYGYDAIKL